MIEDKDKVEVETPLEVGVCIYLIATKAEANPGPTGTAWGPERKDSTY
jgi:hypothetical protein